MKNDLKIDNFSKKRYIFMTVVNVAVAVGLVIAFGKVAPLILATYRIGHHIIKPIFM